MVPGPRPLTCGDPLLDRFHDRRTEEKIHEIRLELCAATFLYRSCGSGDAARLVVAPRLGDRVERIGDCNHSCFERNTFAFDASRISAPVPSLVVRKHCSRQLRIERREWREHVGAPLGMCHHDAPLGWCEPGRFMEDVGYGFVDLADVMKQCDALDAATRSLVEISGGAQYQSVAGDATDVRAGNSIVGVNCVQERFERGGTEALGMNARAPLSDQQSAGDDSKNKWSRLEHSGSLGKKRTSR